MVFVLQANLKVIVKDKELRRLGYGCWIASLSGLVESHHASQCPTSSPGTFSSAMGIANTAIAHTFEIARLEVTLGRKSSVE